ncbi:AMP-binding protein [Corynebacterium lizhenjunii]|uniref:AMP-binding protein n=1 Tax=Corynebacterium lizhenjunii TaxID=2709394 RepID=A0A7T0KGE5_9CORY|nr:AMP-binding protein [Corynebacterium lizhenjunii]QPK79489.1 AMP-binding protein [Corynebacterium lizhenjunii]
MTSVTEQYRAARDFLLAPERTYAEAYEGFDWPRFEHFNFALDWFDHLAKDPEVSQRNALVIREEDDSRTERTYGDLSRASNQVANWLREQGAQRGDRVMLMLDNRVELWEAILGCMKLGLVVCPTTTMLGRYEVQDRIDRAEIPWVVVASEHAGTFAEVTGDYTLILVDDGTPEVGERTVLRFAHAYEAADEFTPDQPTKADELFLIYFTSGTTSLPKMVGHTHTTYPVGHLSSTYMTGCREGDIFLNISAPGWVAWAYSCFFSEFISGGTVFIYNYRRFDAAKTLQVMAEEGVTVFQAPATVYRMMIRAGLELNTNPPRSAVSGGEPLDTFILKSVREAWGIDVRDIFGQTESTVILGTPLGIESQPGITGRPVPGYEVKLVDPATGEEGDLGELCVKLKEGGAGITSGYVGDPDKTAEAFRDGYYHVGDIFSRNEEGLYSYVGRADEVFKSSDYRLSPFELETVLIEHPAVLEVAVVPSPDPIRLTVPKAYVVVAPDHEASAETAESILRFGNERLAPYKRIRRLEFSEGFPKTVSGKIRRVELRNRESELRPAGQDVPSVHGEFTEDDFPGLRPQKKG